MRKHGWFALALAVIMAFTSVPVMEVSAAEISGEIISAEEIISLEDGAVLGEMEVSEDAAVVEEEITEGTELSVETVLPEAVVPAGEEITEGTELSVETVLPEAAVPAGEEITEGTELSVETVLPEAAVPAGEEISGGAEYLPESILPEEGSSAGVAEAQDMVLTEESTYVEEIAAEAMMAINDVVGEIPAPEVTWEENVAVITNVSQNAGYYNWTLYLDAGNGGFYYIANGREEVSEEESITIDLSGLFAYGGNYRLEVIPAVDITQEDGTYTYYGSSTVLTKYYEGQERVNPLETLYTPEDVRWSSNTTSNGGWDILFDTGAFYEVTNYRYVYSEYEVYCDDELVYESPYSYSISDYTTQNTTDGRSFYYQPKESGVYKARVRLYVWDGSTYQTIYSEWSDFTEGKTYVKPETSIGTTVAIWDAENPGYFTFEEVEGAELYNIKLYKEQENYDGSMSTYLYHTWAYWKLDGDYGDGTTAMDHLNESVRNAVFSGSSGRYYIIVQALSGEPDKVASGQEGAKSDYFETYITAEWVETELDKVLYNGEMSAEEKLSAVRDGLFLKEGSYRETELAAIISGNSSLMDKFVVLEKQFMEEKNITVNISAADAVKELFDVDKITIMGAAFSGEENSTLTLKIDVAEMPENNFSWGTLSVNPLTFTLVNAADGSVIDAFGMPLSVRIPEPYGFSGFELQIYKQRSSSNGDKWYEMMASNHSGGYVSFGMQENGTYVLVETLGTVEEPEVTWDGTTVTISDIQEGVSYYRYYVAYTPEGENYNIWVADEKIYVEDEESISFDISSVLLYPGKYVLSVGACKEAVINGELERISRYVDIEKEITEKSSLIVNPKDKLYQPKDVHWGDKLENYNGWDITFDSGVCYETEDGYVGYQLEIYRDDQLVSVEQGYQKGYSTQGFSDDFFSKVKESGIYKARVRARYWDYENQETIYSDWSDFTEGKTYVKPEKSLGTTTAKWDEKKIGYFTFDEVEDADCYRVVLYREYDYGNGDAGVYAISSYTNWSPKHYMNPEEAWKQLNESFRKTILQNGEGCYHITVQALSEDQDAIANGVIGEKSSTLDTRVTADKAQAALESVLNSDISAEEKVNAVKETLGISESGSLSGMQLAMQTDDEVNELISDLEKQLQEEKNIETKAAVSEKVQEYNIQAESISMVGAAFSAEENSTVSLNVDIAEKPDNISNAYYKSIVPLEISLVKEENGEKVEQLEMPITIEMPIPAGLDGKRLVMFHVHNQGTPNEWTEIVDFRYEVGKIIFTVTDFSTFVFAEEKGGEDFAKEQIEAFVKRMYQVCLGREADEGGLNYWTDDLMNSVRDGADLAVQFIFSEELTGRNYDDAKFIETLYTAFFNREADEGGKTYWCNALAAGTTRQEVLAGFVNSQEFFDVCAEFGISRGVLRSDGTIVNLGIYRFAERLYTTVLERSAERAGIEYWTFGIDNKEFTPEAAAIAFFFCEEYTSKNTSNEQYVCTLYRTFMGREADEAGLGYWLSAMQGENGKTRETVLRDFAASPEFQEIMKEYGLQ